jgi:hypothetical protein
MNTNNLNYDDATSANIITTISIPLVFITRIVLHSVLKIKLECE